MQYSSVYQLFRDVCQKNPSKPAYLSKIDGQWRPTTWTEQQATCRRITKGLIALGIQPGDRVGLLAQTRLEWMQVDMGIVCAGAATVGIYPSTLGPDCAYLVDFSGARVLILENEEQLQKIMRVRAQMPALEKIVIVDAPSTPVQGVLLWNEFLAQGDAVPDAEFEARTAALGPEDLAALVATSGTTGVPKLAMITHRNMLFSAWSVRQRIDIGPEYRTLLFLPLAHVFARVTAYFCLAEAITVAFAQNLTTVAEDLREIKPDFIASVPRIFEKVHEKILTDVAAAPAGKQRIFHWAIATGIARSRCLQQKRPVPPGLRLKYAIADRLVFHKIRAALGGQLRWAISGAAPLSAPLAEFFHACGLLILEGLGMTENTSFSNVNSLDNYKFGSVGQPGPGIEMKRAEDGEILFRAPNVMRAYFNNPEATAEVLDDEGWLHTGDIGEIDEQGFLRITDRKKDLIITAGGKNVAPQHIERILRSSPYVSQAVVFGDRRKYITALVTLEPANIRTWAAQRGLNFDDLAALAATPQVRELIQKDIAAANEQLASFEQVKKFTILPHDLSIEGGELTPTLKIKRKVVVQKYGHLVDALYAADTRHEPGDALRAS